MVIRRRKDNKTSGKWENTGKNKKERLIIMLKKKRNKEFSHFQNENYVFFIFIRRCSTIIAFPLILIINIKVNSHPPGMLLYNERATHESQPPTTLRQNMKKKFHHTIIFIQTPTHK